MKPSSRPSLLALLLCALTLPSLPAQTDRPLLLLGPLEGPGMEAGDLKALRELLAGAILELEAFRLLEAREGGSADAEPGPSPAPEYLLEGRIVPRSGLLHFSLEATRLSNGEKRRVSETLLDRGELVLAARRLIRRLLDRESLPAAEGLPTGLPGEAGLSAVPAKPRPSLAELEGEWIGDRGLDRARLYRDGRGIAYLASGAIMRIQASLRGDLVEILQAQPNLPEFYRSEAIDFAAARLIAAEARPWKWVFSLSADGASLFGIKESSFVSREAGGALRVDNDYVREAAWLRASR